MFSKTNFSDTKNLSTAAIGTLIAILAFSWLAPAQTNSGTYMAIVKWSHIPIKGKGSKACVIVGWDGQYHLEALAGSEAGRGKMGKLMLHTGYLPDESLTQLKDLLQSSDLVDLGSNVPPSVLVIDRDTERVDLRIHRDGGTQDLMFADGDGKHPTPPAVLAFIGWIKSVEGFDDATFKDAEPNSCRALEATKDFTPQLYKR